MIALSALNDVGDEPVATKRVAFALRSSGVPVTITTLCHIVTFMIGFWSGYKVVRIVSAYTGKQPLLHFNNLFQSLSSEHSLQYKYT